MAQNVRNQIKIITFLQKDKRAGAQAPFGVYVCTCLQRSYHMTHQGLWRQHDVLYTFQDSDEARHNEAFLQLCLSNAVGLMSHRAV